MLSSYSEYPYFVRTTKAAFWEDREHVKKLIKLYQSHICLWDMKIGDYKKYCNKEESQGKTRSTL